MGLVINGEDLAGPMIELAWHADHPGSAAQSWHEVLIATEN